MLLRRRSSSTIAGVDVGDMEEDEREELGNEFTRKSEEAEEEVLEEEEVELSDTDDEAHAKRSRQVRRFLGWEAGRSKWWKIYALHFLFMWNTRMYEYASVSLPLSSRRCVANDFRLCLWRWHSQIV